MTRTPALRTLLIGLAAVAAVAVPASAGLGLPIGIPSASQSVATPAGTTDLSAGEHGADLCQSIGTPALPALPAVPALPLPALPVPVPVPSAPEIPDASANGKVCAHAGTDGANASIDADAAGSKVGAAVDAKSPVDAEQVAGDAQSTAGEATGFLEGLMDKLFGWI